MKKELLILIVALMGLFPSIINAQSTSSTSAIMSSDDEVSLNVERSTGEVKLALQIKDITQYHHIVVERSAESPSYFGKCKYISCSSAKITEGKLMEADKYPYSATKDVYYRIKTVTNDGVERAYPAVLLAAVTQ